MVIGYWLSDSGQLVHVGNFQCQSRMIAACVTILAVEVYCLGTLLARDCLSIHASSLRLAPTANNPLCVRFLPINARQVRMCSQQSVQICLLATDAISVIATSRVYFSGAQSGQCYRFKRQNQSTNLPILSAHYHHRHCCIAQVWANNLLLDEERLPPFAKNSNFVSSLANGTDRPSNDSQNMFQSSISCGQSEFYVQITFMKPFKGLLYAYRNIQSDELGHGLNYNIQVLDSCTLRGNGASVIYLELSFLSECIEQLSTYVEPEVTSAVTPTEAPSKIVTDTTQAFTVSNLNNETSNKFNLDGFNFRRALDNPLSVNISSDQVYQLSLYIQNDPNIEQKTDSKVTIQCSSQVTKNIIFERNLSTDYSRKVDPKLSLMRPTQNRTIIPSASLVVETYQVNETYSEVASTRMDILRGRVPFVKLIDKSVELGDDLTLIIRANKLDGFDSRVSRCYAHEGNNSTQHELTNEKGCPVDGSVMTAFKVMHQPGTDSQVHYTSFAAFKFSGHSNLHIECRLLLCHKSCPEVSCENATRAR